MFNQPAIKPKGSKRQSGSSTVIMLSIFFLSIASVSTGLLYFEQRHQNGLLKEKVSELQRSQVLLMVPEAQAEAIASWLEAYPEAAANLIKQARPGQQTQMVIDPAASHALKDQPSSYLASAKAEENSTAADTEKSSVILSQDDNGVKTIRLANGGILVTTRNAE